MSVNISALGNLSTAEPLDLDTYSEVKTSTFQLPTKGRYHVRAPQFTEASFGATQKGDLKAQVDPTIVGGDFDGFALRFINISAKRYERPKNSGKMVSQFGDYLRACGRTGALPGDPQVLADAVAATAGTIYEVDLDWKAYNSATGMEVRGMDKFPVVDGVRQSWIEDPGDIQEDGSPKRLRANLEVKNFIPAKG